MVLVESGDESVIVKGSSSDLIDYDLFKRLCLARDFLAAHYNEHVSLPRAACEAYFSPFHFQRAYRRAFGETPHDFQTRLRLDQAKQMLRKRDMTVSEICLEIGYESLGTFSKRFSQRFGYAPTEFRRVFEAPAIWALKIIPGCMYSHWY